MAKPKKRKKKPGYVAPPTTVDTDAVITELLALRGELEAGAEGATWGHAQKLLLSMKADASEVAKAVMGRDLPTFDRLLATLQGEVVEAPVEQDDAPLPEIPDEELRKAMKAFRRRLKLTKLDHESKLGRSPLSTGKDADFDSIIPPMEFSPETWKVLAARGELESTGRGFYMLPKAPPKLRT
ncbi:MAG: hypothetical protein P8K80_06725 [Phycisphaerales bacterium]|nr:hypothetical protein [Phycisphaerales bacterium]